MLPVDLVVNGEYYGSYLLAEQIRIGKTRVDIDELGPDDNEEPDVTGGYLLAMMGTADQELEENCFTTENGMRFLFEEPAFDFSEGAEESGTQAQRDYITGDLQKTENAILGKNHCDENGVSYTEYMDLQSAADYWWVQVFSDSYDAYRPITDVAPDSYYTEAVLWAVENEITNGKTETTFGPDDPCTRAQAVTFLYRAK